MTITSITIKLFGRKASIYRVMKAGEVIQVFVTIQEAQAWIAKAKSAA